VELVVRSERDVLSRAGEVSIIGSLNVGLGFIFVGSARPRASGDPEISTLDSRLHGNKRSGNAGTTNLLLGCARRSRSLLPLDR
jgi:hypothetical protein